MVRGLVAFGTGEREVEAEDVRGVDPRVRHVVAVADPRVAESLDVAELLPNGEQIGEHLARMYEVGEAIDDRDRCILPELLDVLVREGANHDSVDVA